VELRYTVGIREPPKSLAIAADRHATWNQPTERLRLQEDLRHTQEIFLAAFQSFQEQAFGILCGNALPLRLARNCKTEKFLVAHDPVPLDFRFISSAIPSWTWRKSGLGVTVANVAPSCVLCSLMHHPVYFNLRVCVLIISGGPFYDRR
jgi:hypothetical protein